MAWSFVAAGTVATGANPSPGLPAGYAANDIFILAASSETSPSSSVSGYTVLLNTGPNPRLGFWWRLATASESAPTLSDSDASTCAVLLDYRGLNTSPIDASSALNSATSPVSAPQVQPSAPNDAVLNFFVSLATEPAWTTPPGTTIAVNSAASSTVCSLLVVHQNWASYGLTPVETASSGGTCVAATLALKQLQPAITAQPANQYVTPGTGASVTFSVTATASSGSLSYQWYKNGSSIGGATSSTYNYTPVYPTDQGTSFYCAVTDSNATVNTNAASPIFRLPTRFTKRPTQLLPHRYQDFKSELTVKRWF